MEELRPPVFLLRSDEVLLQDFDALDGWRVQRQLPLNHRAVDYISDQDASSTEALIHSTQHNPSNLLLPLPQAARAEVGGENNLNGIASSIIVRRLAEHCAERRRRENTNRVE